MRHHFGDSLDRDGGYWTTIPNRERYAYRIGDVSSGSEEVTTVTIGKDDEHWSRAWTLPNLEELTLHEPTPEQLQAAGELHALKRLRITHARPRSIEFIESMRGVEELVLEYVSGFSDLSPVRALKRLRALHIENLRRVEDFSGLSGIESLRYLAIHGTLDWKQPIRDFEFLRGLAELEVLNLWQIISKQSYPALLPAIDLCSLKILRLHGSYLAAEEYALLEECLSGVEGAAWGPFHTLAYSSKILPPNDIRARLPEEVIRASHPEVRIRFDGKREIDDPDSLWFEFTGKGAGRIKCGSPRAEQRCAEYAERYNAMKQMARAFIDQQPASPATCTVGRARASGRSSETPAQPNARKELAMTKSNSKPKAPGASRASKPRMTATTSKSPKASATAKPGASKTAPIKAPKGGKVVLLSGGNPQIAKAYGDAPVQAYIAAMPGWKRDVGRRLDELIVSAVPNVYKAVKWNTPFYGLEGQGWFLGFHCITKYVKVAFFRGASLRPLPPVESKQKNVRYFHIYENDQLDEAQFVAWVKQASQLPGERL